MKAYVEEYMRMKICCSGVLNEEQCQHINATHKSMGLNVNIMPSDTSDNPGQRQVAKIALNSVRGKFGQRANLKLYTVLSIHSSSEKYDGQRYHTPFMGDPW